MVRITVQGKQEATACYKIREQLFKDGCASCHLPNILDTKRKSQTTFTKCQYQAAPSTPHIHYCIQAAYRKANMSIACMAATPVGQPVITPGFALK